MKRDQKLITYLIIILTLFFLNISMLVTSYIYVIHGEISTGLIKIYTTYHIQFMALSGIFGIAVGIVAYMGFTIQIKDVKKSMNVSKNILLKFLDNNERIIVKYIIEHNNEVVTQSNISRLENMGKVKSFRTIQRLVEKKIIILTPHGKTKRIEFENDIKEVFRN